MRPPRILILPGSNRAASYNARLAGAIVKALTRFDCEITRITLRDYEMPLYDADLESERGVPKNALKLAGLFHAHDAIMLVSPEYNTSLTPLAKNTLDWISRVKSGGAHALEPFRGKLFAISSASPGMYGGMRGLIHLRAVLSSLGALVIPEQVALSHAAQAFDDMDALKDEAIAARMEAMCASLVEKATLLAPRMED
ncbi:MAG: NAD(P)H-dependent oxidoreductase [Nitratireductor sp.]|nr:NAD(P)H-dependent oxidoreductase [Nitratireductor sp.]